MTGVGLFAAAIIGSAVGAAVNGGTWKSFAIGAGIGIAAGVIANGIGGYLGGGTAKGFADWAGKGLINAYVAGALTGAVAGAITSAVYGGNWGTNIGQGAMSGAIGAGVAMATAAAVGKLKAWVRGSNATEQVITASVLPEDQLGDTILVPEGSIITPGSVGSSSEVDAYIAWLQRVDKEFDLSSIDPAGVVQTLGTAGAEYYYLGAVNISNLSVNVMGLGYSYFANRLATKVADAYTYLYHKGSQQVYRGWVRVQPKIYRHGGFLWLKKDWYNNNNVKALWIRATGGKGYDATFGFYDSRENAISGIERLQDKVWAIQEQ